MPLPWRTAWITGASTGIGRELALQLAREGVKVAVSARSQEKLEAVAREHPAILAFPVNVTDPTAVSDVHQRIVAAIGDLDLAILNAGVWHPMKANAFDARHSTESIAVNYLGIVHALEPLIATMKAQRRGHIALVASVAGYRGLPQAAAYAPSKSAVISLAEVLRLELIGDGIDVSVINPGFVETPMTAQNQFPMPFIIKPEDAAARIIRGLTRKRFEIAFPWQLVAILKLARILPYSLYFRLARLTNPK